MADLKIKNFIAKHPILFNLLLIMVTFFVLMYGVLMAIDSFTGHGIYTVVPNVEGVSLNEARGTLEAVGFKCEVSDSTYSNNHAPGTVVVQEPKADSKIKPNRTIYLTMNAVSPRMVTLPSIVDMSCRQGLAMLNGLGLKNIKVDTVYSPYKELILAVKVNGKDANPGMRLPLNSRISVFIGNGFGNELPDSVETENIEEESLVIE